VKIKDKKIKSGVKHEQQSCKNEYRLFFLISYLFAIFACIVITSEKAHSEDSSSPQSIETSKEVNAPDTGIDDKSTQHSLYIAATPSSQLAQSLWQYRISAAESEKDKKYKDELRRLIEQIRSFQFESKSQEPKPVIAIEPVQAQPQQEPNETLLVADLPQEQTEKEIQLEPNSELPYEPLSEQTLQMLESASQQPDQLHNPFELAEILFHSGHQKKAVTFYQQALNRKDPNDVKSARDKAWILFQMGNCLRSDDLQAAGKFYEKIIAEYPNSPWTELAKTRKKLIDWLLTDKPQALIAEYGPLSRGSLDLFNEKPNME